MKNEKVMIRMLPILSLELFVFVAFIGICAIIDVLIVEIPSNPDPVINFIIGFSKVLISVILIGIWLFVWYYLTKRLMLNKEEYAEARKLRKEKKQQKKLQK